MALCINFDTVLPNFPFIMDDNIVCAIKSDKIFTFQFDQEVKHSTRGKPI